MQRVKVVDSHTGGEPTRVVVSGGPDLGRGTMAERLARFKNEFDWFRSAVVNEPRGSDVIVGALLCEPHDASCAAGVIFFNNVGYLGMCGHGTIGLAVTLAHLGRANAGAMKIDTPVGVVEAILEDRNVATVNNVVSWRDRKLWPVDVPGYGKFAGDIAWGGNWFYLIYEHPFQISPGNVEQLTEFTWAVRQALTKEGITGSGGAEIDHIELYGPPQAKGAQSKNFVLCPGKIYDRSPCGTGTSAKLACLAANGKLKPGEMYVQEGILGSVFEATYAPAEKDMPGRVLPTIRGSAYVTGEAELLLDAKDPFRNGIAVGA
ncbi:MAG TPA: proline racemase family protein [Candidatus Acidoferrales bacterium]|nr:proline racemase family protein [Candidatus Acidoferrales bacterium]